jgi:hypothetical protein
MEFSFFFYNLSSRNTSLGSNQPLTEISTKNPPRVIGRSERKADNLMAFCNPLV